MTNALFNAYTASSKQCYALQQNLPLPLKSLSNLVFL